MCPDHPERESEGAECGQGPCLSSCQGKCGATDGFLAASSSCLGGKARLHLLPPRRSSSHVPFPSSLGLFQNPSTAHSSTSAVSQEAKPQRGWRLASVHRTQRDLRNEPQMGIFVCVCVLFVPFERKDLLNPREVSWFIKSPPGDKCVPYPPTPHHQGQPCLWSVEFCKLSGEPQLCTGKVSPQEGSELHQFCSLIYLVPSRCSTNPYQINV